MKKNKLTMIANACNTDKGDDVLCGGGFRGHGFTNFYYDYFRNIKHPVILEIGVFKGESIRMFNEFYNGDCEIHCIDIDPACDVSNIGDNVHFHLVDCGNKEQLELFVENMEDVKFDIILDDASHVVYHQMLTYSYFRKMLNTDGIYVMEDLHTSFVECFPMTISEETTTLDFFVKFTPYFRFSDELNAELLNEIKSVTLFNNYNGSHPDRLDCVRNNRSLTAIIKLRN